MSKTDTSIWWIRRDMRLEDNQALTDALEFSSHVIPLFVLDPNLLASPYVGEKRLAFLYANLMELDNRLKSRGSRLFVRIGKADIELSRELDDNHASMIFAEPDYSPYAIARDRIISNHLPIHWSGSPTVYPPDSVIKADGSPYTVYTPYSRAWKRLPRPSHQSIIKEPEYISTPDHLENTSIPDAPLLPVLNYFPPGEEEAHRRLMSFTSGRSPGIYEYATNRNRPDLDATSKLSPYLRFGIISARQIAVAAYAAIQAASSSETRMSAEIFLNEIIWREFYCCILYHFPQVRRQNFRMLGISWLNNPQDYLAWCEGRTGYPIVDAAMRQLNQTGWMHNRPRMITASFLTKDLLIDWKWGERWFMQHLIDGDPAANNGGWQWTAGTGTDAAPYFRIFNPIIQSARFDPEGAYIRKWLPELMSIPIEYIHQPWIMPLELQRKVNCVIGKDYPNPIVDHHWARERALRVYGKGK